MVAGGEGTGHGDRLQHERQDRSRCQRRQPSPCEVRGGVLAGPTARIVSLPHSSQRSALGFIEDREAPRVDRVEKPLSDSPDANAGAPTVRSAEGRD
jgi:hypothetical protein